MKERESDMFGKSKGNAANSGRVPGPVQHFERLAAAQGDPESPETISSISADVTIVGKVTGNGTIKVFGRVEGELRASTLVIADGAQVEGDIVAEDVTIGGRLKGTVHANRVKLQGTATVHGDIFHRSLAIEENARFEGSSRREDAPVEQPRAQGSRVQPVILHDRKPNGSPDGEAHAAAAE